MWFTSLDEMMEMPDEKFNNYQAFVFDYCSTPFDLHDNCPEAYGEFDLVEDELDIDWTDFYSEPFLELIGA